jgi:hypothetical protein
MTDAPPDLLAFRTTVLRLTGLPGVADVGIVGDGAHQRTGGYHEGRDVLSAIGRYHPGAAAGSGGEDYSARTARDRRGLTNRASAMDIGAGWPRGGRAAWLRYNALLVAALRAGDPELAALRALNYSPDGHARKRVDREHGFTVESSTDSVTGHTHHEWYRDTDGRRGACLDRMARLINQAITGVDVTTVEKVDDFVDPRLEAVADMFDTIHRGPLKGQEVALVAYLKALGSKLDTIATSVGAAAAPVLSDAQVAGVAAAIVGSVAALTTADQPAIEAAIRTALPPA